VVAPSRAKPWLNSPEGSRLPLVRFSTEYGHVGCVALEKVLPRSTRTNRGMSRLNNMIDDGGSDGLLGANMSPLNEDQFRLHNGPRSGHWPQMLLAASIRGRSAGWRGVSRVCSTAKRHQGSIGRRRCAVLERGQQKCMSLHCIAGRKDAVSTRDQNLHTIQGDSTHVREASGGDRQSELLAMERAWCVAA
jgi:hypothetical protein